MVFLVLLVLKNYEKCLDVTYVLIKLPNFIFLVEGIFSLFCPLRGVEGNPASSGPTVILRESKLDTTRKDLKFAEGVILKSL